MVICVKCGEEIRAMAYKPAPVVIKGIEYDVCWACTHKPHPKKAKKKSKKECVN